MNRSSLAHEIKPTPIEIQCVADVKLDVGEAPLWSVIEQCLYFVDIADPQLLRYRPDDGSVHIQRMNRTLTALAYRANGGLILVDERGFSTYDLESRERRPLAVIDREPEGNRFNDGKCDRRGRLWAGTMDKTKWDAPVGALYRLNGDGSITEVLKGVRCSNGLGWSPDSRTFYYTESFAHRILAFDHDPDTGALSGRRLFASLAPNSGAFPDGLTVDVEGFVWSAQPFYGRLVRYAPDGAIASIYETPVSRPTSCAFGGTDLATLYITTAHNSLTAEQRAEEPLAGGLFEFRPGVKGIPEAAFAG
jgi:L-arabinonolactonase